MVFDVRFRPTDIGDLFLRARRDGLVFLELGDARLPRVRNVLVRGVLVVCGHGGSFGRRRFQRMPRCLLPEQGADEGPG
jgi:hypothetical protein